MQADLSEVFTQSGAQTPHHGGRHLSFLSRTEECHYRPEFILTGATFNPEFILTGTMIDPEFILTGRHYFEWFLWSYYIYYKQLALK